MPVRARTGWLGVTLLSTLAAIGGATARAAGVETLLMPGKVTQAHAKYETECSQCHDRSDRSAQSRLCADCHEEIAVDISGRRGYHGRMANAGGGQCRACHSEHGGRDSDIVQLDTAQFDHALTDFALEGAHRTLACAACHKSGEAWSKVSATCGACHKDDDRHQGQLGQQRRLPRAGRLDGGALRSWQDAVRADWRAPADRLQRLPPRWTLQG